MGHTVLALSFLVCIHALVSGARGNCQKPGACSQVCVEDASAVEGHRCECESAYMPAQDDPTRCVAKDGHTFLLFASHGEIRRISPKGKESLTIIANASKPLALDFDFRTGMIFWSDAADSRIYKAPINEGGSRKWVVSGVEAWAVCVDWVHSLLYWTSGGAGKGRLEVSNMEGGMRLALVEGLHRPQGLALDPIEAWMYWSDASESGSVLERAGMDGSRREVIVDEDVGWPQGVAVDLQKRRLVWLDSRLHSVSSCNLDGSDRVELLQSDKSLLMPLAVATFEDWVYWSDAQVNSIFKVDKFTGEAFDTVMKLDAPPQDIRGLQVYHPYRQPDGDNRCLPLNGHCSHLCLPSPQVNETSDQKYSCACPNGLWLDPERRNCLGMRMWSQAEEETGSGAAAVIGAVVAVVVVTALLVAVGVILYRRKKTAVGTPPQEEEEETS